MVRALKDFEIDAGTIKILKERFKGRDIPDAYRVLARNAEVLKTFIGFRDALMAEGKVNSILKEKIALAVSRVNECNPCYMSHSKKLEMLKVTPEAENEKEGAAIEFATDIAMKRGKVGKESIQDVLRVFDEDEILEIALVTCLYMFLNTFNNLISDSSALNLKL